MRAAAALVLAVLLLAAACDQPGPTALPDTGIKGVVIIGPTCPVQQPGQSPCVAPYVATLVITKADDGTVVARLKSAADGTFQVVIPPGSYLIAPQPGGDPFPVGQLVSVRVDAGAFSSVEIAYDSGIR